MNAGFKIKRRDDLIPNAICLKFRITATVAGQQLVQVSNDVAGTISGTVVEGIGGTGQLQTIQSYGTASPAYVGGSANSTLMQALQNLGRRASSTTATIDMEGNKYGSLSGTIVTIPVNTATPAGGGTALAFWSNLFPELADMTSPDFVAGSSVTMTDDSGTPINSTSYPGLYAGSGPYLLTRGQIAPWMATAGAVSVRAHITASFTGTENNAGLPTKLLNNATKHATVTLCSIPGGTYQSSQLVGAGEVIPYGLAGYIYNIEKIPQYEGTFTIQETEITDQCPLGNNLNLTGSLAEWSTMQACVQQISYDITAGRTTLTFGPAGHLGPKDFVERLRVNRGPRWFNLNGNNVQNAPNQDGATPLGQDTAQMNPQPGPNRAGFEFWSTSEPDLAAHGSAYAAGAPGVTVDNRGSGQPNYGNISVPSGFYAPVASPTGPTHFGAGGSGGTLTGLWRLNVDDCFGKKLWIQEYAIKFDFQDGNGCVDAFVMLLGSFPYVTSVHSPATPD